MRPLPLLALASLTCLAVACSAQSGAEGIEGATAISKSQRDARLASSIGQLLVQKVYADGTLGPNNYCTAAVIAPRMLLTSGACFGFDQWAWQTNDWGTRAVFVPGPEIDLAKLSSAALGFDAPNVGKADALVPDEFASSDLQTQLKNSVALVPLYDNIAGLLPLPLAEAPSDGAPVSIYGYGCDGDEKYGTLRTRDLSWGEWSGWLGTDFRCGPGDLGASIVNGAGNLVGVATPSGDVIPLKGDLLELLRSKIAG
jgi:hypothetical protein